MNIKNIIKFLYKVVLQIIIISIFFSTANAKKPNKFEKGKYISNYFSGIILFNNNEFDGSYSFLKKLDGLEQSHDYYTTKYLFSLVNLGKLSEAFYYSKKLEKKGLSNFESDLITGIYHLKNEEFDKAKKYFLKIKENKSEYILNDFIPTSLLNWASFNKLNFEDARQKINSADFNSEKLKNIQNTFLNCYYKNEKTEFFFKKLVSSEKDFSRYNYFYVKYLFDIGKNELGGQVLEESLISFPRNLLLNEFKINLKNKKKIDNFNCQNESHVIAEIFYIASNLLSSQNLYSYSNFYLNLAKFLNKNFYSFDTLLAENFLNLKNYKQAKKIYYKLKNKGDAFSWHAAKQEANIYLLKDEKEKALNLLSIAFNKIQNKTVYDQFDYAEFLKNNKEFEKSIKYYTEILNLINKSHFLFSEVMDSRGVAHERTGEWTKAEKDLLASLEVRPDQAYVINYLAYSWIEQGIKIDQSLKMLEKANKLKSNDPYIIDSIGWALFKLKRYKESKKYLQQAVKLMPADPIVNDHYGDVLWKNGKEIEARYYWRYVLNLESTEKELKKNIKNKLILGI